MKKRTKQTGLSMTPVFKEVLLEAKRRSLPVIRWSDDRVAGRSEVCEPDLATAFEVACEHIHNLEAQLIALARANVR